MSALDPDPESMVRTQIAEQAASLSVLKKIVALPTDHPSLKDKEIKQRLNSEACEEPGIESVAESPAGLFDLILSEGSGLEFKAGL